MEVKRAISREEQQKAGFRTGGRSDNGVNIRTKKIFVGGLPPTLTEDGFHQYFESYGHVTDVVIMIDQSTQRPRGFGFVTFDTEDAVDRVLHKSFHDLNGKTVEVKRALPRDSYSGSGGHSGGGGGGYQGHHSLSSGNGLYDDGQDGNMYMQPHATGAGFVDYGAGYGVQGYGYGPTNTAVAYGGFGVVNYSMMGPGYSALYGGYGNQNTAYSDDQYSASAFMATGQSQNGAATYGYYGGQDGSLASKSSHDSGKGYANRNGDSDFTNTARCSNRSQDGNYGTDKTGESGGGKAGAYGVPHPHEGQQQ